MLSIRFYPPNFLGSYQSPHRPHHLSSSYAYKRGNRIPIRHLRPLWSPCLVDDWSCTRPKPGYLYHITLSVPSLRCIKDIYISPSEKRDYSNRLSQMATTGNHRTRPPPRPLTSAGTAPTNNPAPSVASSYLSVGPAWAERPPQNLNPWITWPPLLPLDFQLSPPPPSAHPPASWSTPVPVRPHPPFLTAREQVPTARTRTTHFYPTPHSKAQQIPIPGHPNDTLLTPELYPRHASVVPGSIPNCPTVGNQIRRKRLRELEPEPGPATFRCRLPQCQAAITGHVAARLSGFCSHTHMQFAIHMRMAKQCPRCRLRACPEGRAFCSAEECANRRRRSLYNILLHAFRLRSSTA
ncbi:hypothetical protein EDB85DRAFT_2000074 [Lactarius pseudohatsudake]|nr:hypothetical protein EDB85DRAFT_2000074 [Lactarius pseudohatsudake]